MVQPYAGAISGIDKIAERLNGLLTAYKRETFVRGKWSPPHSVTDLLNYRILFSRAFRVY